MESQQWKRTSSPSKGRYEATNLLRDSIPGWKLQGGEDTQRDRVIHAEIIQVGDERFGTGPLICTFRVHRTDEFISAVQTKLELQQTPKIFFINEINGEQIECTDIRLLPDPARLVIQPKSDLTIEQEIFKVLLSQLSIKDRRYRLKTYPNCFIGSQMVDFMVDKNLLAHEPGQITTRKAAVEFGNMLWETGKLEHVVDAKKPFLDKYLFYRFVNDMDPTTRRRSAPDSFEHRKLSITAYTWGAMEPIPAPLFMPEVIVEVACGTSHCLALDADGHVYSWGCGARGQLGHQGKTNIDHPQLVRSLVNQSVHSVFAGYDSSAVKSFNALYTWGAINPPRSVKYDARLASLPKALDNGSPLHIVDVRLGTEHVAVLLKADGLQGPGDSQVYTWGHNVHGQLGTGIISNYNAEPIPVPDLVKHQIKQIACGPSCTGALTSKGRLFLWGENMGLSTGTNNYAVLQPQPVVGLPETGSVTCFAIGRQFVVAAVEEHGLYIWGTSEELGFPVEPTPECVPISQSWTKIRDLIAGERHLLVLLEGMNHCLYGFGNNRQGQLALDIPSSEFAMETEIELHAHQVIRAAAGGNRSAAVVVDDKEKILRAAAQGQFSVEREEQRLKLLSFLKKDDGELQDRVRKFLRQKGKDSSRNKVVRSLERVMLRGESELDRQRFELFQTSSVHSIRVSPYRIFGMTHSAFKYVTEVVVLNNEGVSTASYSITIPASPSFRVTASSLQGTIRKQEQARIQFQAIALQSGTYEDVIVIALEANHHTHYHYIWYEIQCEVQLQVPEFPVEQLEGGKRLGSGASGVVSLLELNGQQVAVKKFHVSELSAEEADSFRNEILITSNLSHPNVIECMGVCTKFPILALVLEYMPLRDLSDYINDHRKPAYPIDLLVRICLDVAEGMHYLHQRMVMHRDLKPDNILMNSLDPSGSVACAKLTDFGTSMIASDIHGVHEAGTARYMPLEVLDPSLADEGYDQRKVDVYSYGITIWAVFCRQIPHHHCTFTSQIMESLRSEERVQFPIELDVPEELIDLVHACCHRPYQDRPNFEQIVRSLIQVAEGMPSLNEPVSRLLKTFGSNRALVTRTKESITKYQMDVIDKKIHRIDEKERSLQEQLRQIQENLKELELQRQQLTNDRRRLFNSL